MQNVASSAYRHNPRFCSVYVYFTCPRIRSGPWKRWAYDMQESAYDTLGTGGNVCAVSSPFRCCARLAQRYKTLETTHLFRRQYKTRKEIVFGCFEYGPLADNMHCHHQAWFIGCRYTRTELLAAMIWFDHQLIWVVGCVSKPTEN